MTSVQPFTAAIAYKFDTLPYRDSIQHQENAQAQADVPPLKNRPNPKWAAGDLSEFHEDLQTLMLNNLNIQEWIRPLILKGQNPNLKPISDKAVEISASNKLKDFEIPRDQSITARTQLLTHIFNRAYRNIPEPEKLRIIEASKGQNLKAKALTTSLKIQCFASVIFSNFILRSILNMGLLFVTFVTYKNIGTGSELYFKNTSLPKFSLRAMQKLPLNAIHVINKIIPVVTYVLARQPHLWIFSLISNTLTRWNPRLNNLSRKVFKIILLPLRISVFFIYTIFYTIPRYIFLKILLFTLSLETSFQTSYNLNSNYHLLTGGHEARDIWLQLLDKPAEIAEA